MQLGLKWYLKSDQNLNKQLKLKKLLSIRSVIFNKSAKAIITHKIIADGFNIYRQTNVDISEAGWKYLTEIEKRNTDYKKQ